MVELRWHLIHFCSRKLCSWLCYALPSNQKNFEERIVKTCQNCTRATGSGAGKYGQYRKHQLLIVAVFRACQKRLCQISVQSRVTNVRCQSRHYLLSCSLSQFSVPSVTSVPFPQGSILGPIAKSHDLWPQATDFE